MAGWCGRKRWWGWPALTPRSAVRPSDRMRTSTQPDPALLPPITYPTPIDQPHQPQRTQMPGLGAAGSSGGSTGSTGLGSGPKADLSPVKQIGPSSEGAELPSRLELILCRISAVLKAGHNHHKQTHAEVSQVNHTLSEVQNEIGSSSKAGSLGTEAWIATELTRSSFPSRKGCVVDRVSDRDWVDQARD